MEEVILLRIILSLFRKREMDTHTFDKFFFLPPLSLDHVRLHRPDHGEEGCQGAAEGRGWNQVRDSTGEK